MSSERIQLRLQDIVDNCDWIAEDIGAIGFDAFSRNRQMADAVERCLQRITEAIIHLGEDEVQRSGLGIAWNELRSLGNRLRHDYRRIDRRVIYSIAIEDVPALRAAAAHALES